jgi:hypothetical protein
MREASTSEARASCVVKGIAQMVTARDIFFFFFAVFDGFISRRTRQEKVRNKRSVDAPRFCVFLSCERSQRR